MSTRAKGRSVPKTIRKTLIVSDVDPDLKKWLWENYERSGAVIREALREALVRSGELPDRDTTPLERPAPPPAASRTVELEPTPPPAHTPPPEAHPAVDSRKQSSNPGPQPRGDAGDWFEQLSPEQLKALLEAGRHVLSNDPSSAPASAAPTPPEDPTMSGLLSMGFG